MENRQVGLVFGQTLPRRCFLLVGNLTNAPRKVCAIFSRYTLPKFDSSPMKNGGWKTNLSYWVPVTFQVRTVSFFCLFSW